MGPRVKRVLLYPMNGYVNRLQALASSAILARRFEAPLSVCWTPHPMVPGAASDAFAADWCSRYVVSEDVAARDFGVRLDIVPRYLTVDPRASRISVRGHDRGEQSLMGDLAAALADTDKPVDLVIVAGGSFDIATPDAADGEWSDTFLAAKRDYYRALAFHPAIEEAARTVTARHPDGYLGLHLRYSDRAHQAPRTRTIRAELLRQVKSSGLSDVFIASDSPDARARWTDTAGRLGLRPDSLADEFPRLAATTSAGPALADWRALARAQHLVYFAESSYAVEACVASGSWSSSSALATSGVRAFGHRSMTLGRAAVTYPARHWFSR